MPKAGKLLATSLPLFSLLFAALCINFSWIHREHDSDMILFPLVSIERWTPFLWGDNRYGTLTPLLASFIRDHLWNLLFQTQISALCVVGVLIVGNCYFFHRSDTSSSARIAAASIAFLIALLLFQPTRRFTQVWLLMHPYLLTTVPLLLALALLLRVERGPMPLRFSVAVALLSITVWVNFAMIAPTVLLAACLPHRSLPWRKTLGVRIAACMMALAVFACLRWYASHLPAFGDTVLAPRAMLNTSVQMLRETFEHYLRFAGVIVLLSCTALVVYFRRGSLRIGDGAVFAGVGVVYAAAIAATDWPIRNLYEPRYWTVPIVFVLLPALSWCGIAIADALRRVMGSQQAAGAICTAGVAAASLLVFGAPSPERARNLVLAATGKFAQDARALDCTHMIGEFDSAWITVFHERALGRPLWAVTLRSEETRDQWSRMPREQRRYCGAGWDPAASQRSMVLFDLSLLEADGASGQLIRYRDVSGTRAGQIPASR